MYHTPKRCILRVSRFLPSRAVGTEVRINRRGTGGPGGPPGLTEAATITATEKSVVFVTARHQFKDWTVILAGM